MICIKYSLIVGFILAIGFGYTHAADEKLFELRREYNQVSAGIDSLVRVMHQVDDEVL